MSMPMSPDPAAAAGMNKPGSPYYPYPNRKRPVDDALTGEDCRRILVEINKIT